MHPRPSRNGFASAFILALTMARVTHAEAQSPGAAPSSHSQADAAEAKRKFAAGLKLYGEHAYAEALAEFEGSYRLGGRPSALRNIAQCHRDLKHFADAYESYARLLQAHAAQLSTGDREAVARALDELSDLSGALSITSDPPGAEVTLDGVVLGVTPLASSKRVSLGAHAVVVRKPGFETFQGSVVIESNAARNVAAQLQPEVVTAHVSIHDSQGASVDILVDGHTVGAAPWEGELAPGEHRIEARGATRVATPRTVVVRPKERLDVSLDSITTLGHLRVTTSPASARVIVDGAPVGTGIWDADVPPGLHHVEAHAAGYEPVLRDISVERGQLLALDLPVGAPVARPNDTHGVYVRLSAAGYASPTTTNVYAAPGSPEFHFGFGGALRVGYAFDLLGVEIVGAFHVDHYNESASFLSGGAAGITGLDGFVGLGARVTSHGESVRFSAALAPGVAVHSISVNDDASNGNGCGGAQLNPCSSSNGGSSTANGGYVAPGFLFDGAMILGSGVGGRFVLGVQAMLDFAPTLYLGPDTAGRAPASALYPGLAFKAVSGPQLYVGPTLGVQWGR